MFVYTMQPVVVVKRPRAQMATSPCKEQRNRSGPMPNLMAALPNIGGAVGSTPQSLADAHY